MGLRFNSLWLLALWTSTVLAGFPLRAWNLTGTGSPTIYRVWYGDGQAYVGSTIPPEVKVAFNFTVRDDRNQLFYVEVDRDNSPSNAPRFPEPTFLVANAGTGATDGLYFAHSAVGMSKDNIFIFNGMEGFHWPTTRKGIAPGSAYIVPTRTPGTYIIKWIVNPGSAQAMNGIPITLASRG